MPRLAIHAARAFTPLEEIAGAVILIEDGRIAAIGPSGSVRIPPGTAELDARALTAVPGFVDVHIHGAAGHDVMEGESAALDAIARELARHGTTSFLATTVTSPPDKLFASAASIARYIAAQHSAPRNSAPSNATSPSSTLQKDPCAEILGLHFEGPFISKARRGVHPAEFIAAPDVALLKRMLDAANGEAKIITLAPELHGALDLVKAAVARGVVVSLGHTDATYEQARAAIDRGARHAAHVFNAMRPFSHRDTGVIGAVLTSPEVTAELIADGVHVDTPAMRILLDAKGPAGTILVSDATSATGMPDGKYHLGGIEVTVSGGVSRNAEGKLAGSTLTLDRALRNVAALGVPLPDALRMLTLNPAERIGLEKRKGVLAAGADADIVLLDANLNVAGVLTRGAVAKIKN